MQKKILILSILFFTFLGGISTRKNHRIDILDPVSLQNSLAFGPIELSAAESAWGFVRQSATWANANTNLIDSIIGPIKASGALGYGGTYTQVTGSFIGKLTVDANTSVTSNAYTGSRIYKHKFELWRNDDKTKAMEIFFDSTDDLTGQGVLMIYNLQKCDPLRFTDSLLVETFMSIDPGDTTVRRQTISWAGSFSAGSVSYSNTDRGRVVLETMDQDAVLCFKSVVRFANSGVAGWCPGTGDEYYSLAYGQYFASPNQATAVVSLADNTIDNTVSSNLCGGAGISYGLFRSSGFVSDSNSSGSIPSDYIQSTTIDALFGTVGTTGKGDWDDLSKTKLDGLSISFNNSTSYS